MARPQILPSAQAQYPKSANKTVMVHAAWHPDRATTSRPEAGGMDGWTLVHDFATYEVVRRLRSKGYTWVNLEAGGVAQSTKDVRIDALI